MVLIEWREEYSVGVPDADFEHQMLIELINKLHENISTSDGDYGVADFLGEIYTHISEHFSHEEDIMVERNYDQLLDHKKDHKRLQDNLRAIMDAYEENAYFDDKEYAKNVQKWFIEHFRNHDARLHKYLG